ncbi:DUF2169 family type VI secretion system accessory protein [Arcobacter sp. FWKO B]|uniref:DUF2169 family type VI secretion system accessory protein n=1 Tax=Arcobacter sp. FWKO B TaxID=2593672 RepID=UPI0018A3FD11|nr:DUF2169 domain-containing protein [Arcobacter sp. FWKO B]QOG11535.1 DUF2169 domain-containing protein [Arcobacter sp. FWKO B]
MNFKNHTPFSAFAWENHDNNKQTYITSVCRIKLTISYKKDNELLELKLDKNQGDLFDKDIFFDDSNEKELRYSTDYIPFKPMADIIINANSYSKIALPMWSCGVKVFSQSNKMILEKNLIVSGQRNWIKKPIVGWELENPTKCDKVPLRYSLAYGGEITKDEEIISSYPYNPIGIGLVDKNHPSHIIKAPQIYEAKLPINPDVPYEILSYEGFGNIDRSWEDRFVFGGTYDDNWIKNQSPFLPLDFDYRFYQTSHPDMRLKEYIQPFTTVVLENLLPNASIAKIIIPPYTPISKTTTNTQENISSMNLDTLLIDIDSQNPNDWCIYLSYRSRIKFDEDVISSEIFLETSRDS